METYFIIYTNMETKEMELAAINAELEKLELNKINARLEFHELLISQLNDLSKQRENFTKDLNSYQEMLDSTNKEFDNVLGILMDVQAYNDSLEDED